jgi:hypothetical protein
MSLWGRTLGILSTVGAILLWVAFVFLNPLATGFPAPDTLFIVFLMVSLASTGLAASLWNRPGLLLLAAVASFVPVGLYVLGTPGPFRWIGALNVMTLAAAILWLVDRWQRRAA